MIAFTCEHCGKGFEVKDELAGKRGKCKGCGATIQIPMPATFEVEEAPAPSPQARPRPTTTLQPTSVGPVPMPVQNVQVVVNNPEERKSANGLGVAGVVVGVFALLGSWIPLINLAVLPLIVVGVILSVIGFFVARSSQKSGTNWPIAGLITNSSAFAIVLLVNVVLLAIGASAAREEREKARQNEAARKNAPAVVKPEQVP